MVATSLTWMGRITLVITKQTSVIIALITIVIFITTATTGGHLQMHHLVNTASITAASTTSTISITIAITAAIIAAIIVIIQATTTLVTIVTVT